MAASPRCGRPKMSSIGAQQRVVVVVHGADGARPDQGGQQDRADAAAAGPVLAGQRHVRVVRAEAGCLAAAGGRVAALVEGDHDQAAVPVGRRGHDLRHPLRQERVGLRQPARGAGDAGCVVAVVAQVRRDPGERRGGAGPGQVAGQRPERQDVRVAVGLVAGDRAEEREPVVAGGVLIALCGFLGVIDGPGGGMTAGGPARRADRVVPGRVVAHVLQVRRPAAPGG